VPFKYIHRVIAKLAKNIKRDDKKNIQILYLFAQFFQLWTDGDNGYECFKWLQLMHGGN